jgi:hypothetical protein
VLPSSQRSEGRTTTPVNVEWIHSPDKKHEKNCALEYVYSHSFAPFIPIYYIVSLSSDDHVIEADLWGSP